MLEPKCVGDNLEILVTDLLYSEITNIHCAFIHGMKCDKIS